MTQASEATTTAPGKASADPGEWGSALRELMLAADQYRLATAAYLGLTVTDSQAVSYLLARGPMEQHELAVSMDMTPGSITSVVDRLVERGFAERSPHPTDRRRSIVQISRQGDEQLTDVRRWLTDAFAPVPPERRDAAALIARQLADGLRVRAMAVPERPDGVPERRRRR